MHNSSHTFFAPQLYIKSGITDISFYTKAFGAVELRRWSNDDGSLHVAELAIDGMLFHLHEEKESAGQFSPVTCKGTTALVGLFVPDVDAVMISAINAGATLISKAKTYEYGYRQGIVEDPFGHRWMIEKVVQP